MDTLHFASPWFLAGLASLAAPFLLLLTRPKTFHITPFSSIRFLRAVTQRATKVIEWRRLLLLAARLLTLFSLAAAFSLPFIHRGGNFFGRSQNHLIFILDNSYSMGYRESGQSLFEKSQRITERMARNLGKEKRLFSLYTFNTQLEPLTVRVDKGRFLSDLGKAKVSERGTSFAGLLDGLERKISQEAERTPPDVFIASDFSIREPSFRKEFLSLVQSACKGCRVQLIPVQPQKYRNFSLEQIFLPPRFLLSGAPEEIQVAYQTWGMKGKAVRLSLWVNQTEVDSQTVTLPEATRGILTFRYRFPGPGSYALRVQSSEDALEADNSLYRFVVVREPLRVLFIEDSDYKYPFENPSFYLAQVFESASIETNGRKWIESAQTRLSDFNRLNPSTYDLIVLADVSRLDPSSSSKLRDYLAAGGSVLFAVGRQLEEAASFKSPPLNQLLGGMFTDIKKAEGPEKPIRLGRIPYPHPLFQVFEEGRKGDLSSIQFSKFFAFLPQAKSDYEVLLEFDSGHPALLEMKRENGRLLLWTSSLNLDWTDFPKRPLYVPFALELLKYMTLKGASQMPLLHVGEKLTLDFSSSATRSVTLKTPAGESLTVYAGSKSSPQSVEIEKTGIYEWSEWGRGAPEKRGASANIDTAESRPAYLQIERQKSSLENISNPISRSRLHTQQFLYRPLAYSVLLLLLIEMLLANRLYKARWI